MKNLRIEAIIIAIGLIALGVCLNMGINTIANRDRVVNVKGLSEKEFPADKVTWPLMYKMIGNDLISLYGQMKNTNAIIVNFLKNNGLDEMEINVNAPEIVDMNAERYNNRDCGYRYNFTTVITVTSNKVDLVRKLVTEQSELLKQGVAITGDDYRYKINYEFTQLNKVKPDMIEEATKNARKVALQFAKDSNSKLGKIKRAYQGQFSIVDRDANTPYIKHIRVVATVDYALED